MANVKLGSTDFSKAFVGSAQVNKIYLGSDLVYSLSADLSQQNTMLVNNSNRAFKYYSFIGASQGDVIQNSRQYTTDQNLMIFDIKLIEDNESETSHPTSPFPKTLSNGNEIEGMGAGSGSVTKGPYTHANMTVTAGFSHGAYPPRGAFDSERDSNKSWWTLGNPDKKNEFLTVAFDAPKVIKQVKIRLNGQYGNHGTIRVVGHDHRILTNGYELWGLLDMNDNPELADGYTEAEGNPDDFNIGYPICINRGKSITLTDSEESEITSLNPFPHIEKELQDVTDLRIHIDAENDISYPGTGTNITDLSGNHDATLSGSFHNTGVGIKSALAWRLDKSSGTNTDFISFGDLSTFDNRDFSFSLWFLLRNVGQGLWSTPNTSSVSQGVNEATFEVLNGFPYYGQAVRVSNFSEVSTGNPSAKYNGIYSYNAQYDVWYNTLNNDGQNPSITNNSDVYGFFKYTNIPNHGAAWGWASTYRYATGYSTLSDGSYQGSFLPTSITKQQGFWATSGFDGVGDHDLITKGSHDLQSASTTSPILVWYDRSVPHVTTTRITPGTATKTITFAIQDENDNFHTIHAPSQSVVPGKAYNLVVQHNTAGKMQLWLNGVKEAEALTNLRGGMKSNTQPLKIGAPSAETRELDTNLDVYNFKAYTAFLTEEQIKQNYNNLRGRFGQLNRLL